VGTVVLVHGAFHGAWCFDRVVPLLEDAGLEVIALDLPGHGSSPLPFTDLHGDANFVREALDSLTDDVVLLGHSYGGAVITEAGDHPRVRHLVYLSAFTLDADESCNGVTADSRSRFPHEGRPNLAAGRTVHSDGTMSVAAEAMRQSAYNDCDEETAAWATRLIGRQPLANLGQAPSRVAWRLRPSTYIVCTEDMGIHPMLQEIFAARCSERRELHAGHSAFASRPSEVSEILVELAR
jgi:pimeloyl-ACP methyl ester carboxylesterase